MSAPQNSNNLTVLPAESTFSTQDIVQEITRQVQQVTHCEAIGEVRVTLSQGGYTKDHKNMIETVNPTTITVSVFPDPIVY